MVYTILFYSLLVHLLLITMLFFYDFVYISKKPIFIIILFWIPIIGFIIYLFLVETKLIKKKNDFPISDNVNYQGLIGQQKDVIYDQNNEYIQMALGLNCLLTSNQEATFLTNVKEFYQKICNDIETSNKSIYLSYYIFKKDDSTKRLIQLLEKKSLEGVTIYIVYDYNGCLFTRTKKLFKRLKKNGATVIKFSSNIKRFKLNFNYFNHRKLAIIDENITYIGSTNFSNKELGQAKIKKWTDTAMRIVGNIALVAKTEFIQNISTVYRKTELFNELKKIEYKNISDNGLLMQLISSDPLYNKEKIKDFLLKLLITAKKSVCIMSPFLNLDKSMYDAIKIAAKGNVKVKIILPLMIDCKIFSYIAFSFIKDLFELGVEMYLYNGYDHTKMFIIDEQVSLYGSYNLDKISSYSNFETNVIVYDQNIVKEMQSYFDDQLLNCIPISISNIKKYVKDKKIRFKFIKYFKSQIK